MSILSRRSVLAGSAAGAASTFGLWAKAARAAAPADSKQAASFYRYKVGNVEITVVSDGINALPVTPEFIPNVSVEEVNAALRENFMQPRTFVYPFNPIVINTGSRLIVLDMGTGEAAYDASKGMNGQLMANLLAAGIDRNAKGLIQAGFLSAVSNRKALRVGQEPLSVFRRYMAAYARQQALCFYDPGLLANIERHWQPQTRRMA